MFKVIYFSQKKQKKKKKSKHYSHGDKRSIIYSSLHNHVIYNDHISLCYALYGGYTVRKKDNRKYNGFPFRNAASIRTQFKIPRFILSWVSSSAFRECCDWRHWSWDDLVFTQSSRYVENGCLLDAKWGRTLFLASQALELGSLKLKGIYSLSRSMIVRVRNVFVLWRASWSKCHVSGQMLSSIVYVLWSSCMWNPNMQWQKNIFINNNN